MRLFHLADTAEVFHRAGGVEAAVEVARARRGRHFDPEIVDLFCGAARDVLADLDAVTELEVLIGGAELQGTVPMWAWVGDEAATTFSY